MNAISCGFIVNAISRGVFCSECYKSGVVS